MRLAVAEVDRPFDPGVGGGEFLDHLVVRVQSVEAKSGSLSLQGALSVPIEIYGLLRRFTDFRADEEVVAGSAPFPTLAMPRKG